MSQLLVLRTTETLKPSNRKPVKYWFCIETFAFCIKLFGFCTKAVRFLHWKCCILLIFALKMLYFPDISQTGQPILEHLVAFHARTQITAVGLVIDGILPHLTPFYSLLLHFTCISTRFSWFLLAILGILRLPECASHDDGVPIRYPVLHKIMNLALKMMYLALKMTCFALTMMYFALTMMYFALNMMNFGRCAWVVTDAGE